MTTDPNAEWDAQWSVLPSQQPRPEPAARPTAAMAALDHILGPAPWTTTTTTWNHLGSGSRTAGPGTYADSPRHELHRLGSSSDDMSGSTMQRASHTPSGVHAQPGAPLVVRPTRSHSATRTGRHSAVTLTPPQRQPVSRDDTVATAVSGRAQRSGRRVESSRLGPWRVMGWLIALLGVPAAIVGLRRLDASTHLLSEPIIDAIALASVASLIIMLTPSGPGVRLVAWLPRAGWGVAAGCIAALTHMAGGNRLFLVTPEAGTIVGINLVGSVTIAAACLAMAAAGFLTWLGRSES